MAAQFSIPAADTTLTQTPGQSLAPLMRLPAANTTQLCGPVTRWSSGVDTTEVVSRLGGNTIPTRTVGPLQTPLARLQLDSCIQRFGLELKWSSGVGRVTPLVI